LNYNYITKDFRFYYLTIKFLSIFRGVLNIFSKFRSFIGAAGLILNCCPNLRDHYIIL
jgi:hypothetical protein